MNSTALILFSSLSVLGTAFVTTLPVAAATLTYTATYPASATTPLEPTDPGDTTPTDIVDAALIPSIPQFNPVLGNLLSVTLDYTALLVGDASVESLDAAAQTLTIDLNGVFTLVSSECCLFDNTVNVSTSRNVTAYDGSLDFGGTSGLMIQGLTGNIVDQRVYLPGDAEFANFVGLGNIPEFRFTATTDSDVTGAANIASLIRTRAGTTLTVTYNYETETVPEPSVLLGMGLVASAALTLRKKALSPNLG